MIAATFDVMDPTNHGIPLWVTYDTGNGLVIWCCVLRAYDERFRQIAQRLSGYSPDGVTLVPAGERGSRVCIWGYSVYKRVPGFRTFGNDVRNWIGMKHDPRWFKSHEAALEHVAHATTPRCAP